MQLIHNEARARNAMLCIAHILKAALILQLIEKQCDHFCVERKYRFRKVAPVEI